MAALLTASNCFPKNVHVLAVVVAELEFGNVQRKVFAAYPVEGAHHAALNQALKAFNRL